MNTNVIKEYPVLTVEAWCQNDFESTSGEEICIYMSYLRGATVGRKWEATYTGSSTLCGSHYEKIEVVYKNGDGICLLRSETRFTNSDNPRLVAEDPELIWVEFGKPQNEMEVKSYGE